MSPPVLPAHPRVCVIGAGAIGGLFGVRLAQAGARLSVVARGATLAALQAEGWTLEAGGKREVAPVQSVSDARLLGVQDVVVLAVKAYSLGEVMPHLAPLLGPATLVVPALNGVPWWFTDPAAGLPVHGALERADPGGRVAASLPVGAVIGCVAYTACSTPTPGVARHDSGSRMVFGEVATARGLPPSPRLQALVAWLKGAGLDAEASSDLRVEVWKKLLGNACFNPVSVLTGSATDRLIDDPAVHALFTRLMHETLAVGRAMGVDAGIEPPARLAITRQLGHIKTSMLQDAEAGRPLEVDAILGAVTELARRLGVATPVADTVYALTRMRAHTFGLLKN